MADQSIPRKPRRLRRYAIAVGAIAVLGGVAYVYAPVASDLVRSTAREERKALARDIVDAAGDKFNWTELGKCKGVKDGKPVFVRVSKSKWRVGKYRRIRFDVDKYNSLGAVQSLMEPKPREKQPAFERRGVAEAEKICGTPVQLKLQP